MHNLNIDNVVMSIEKTKLTNLQGIIYQEYSNFFGKIEEFQLPDDENFQLLENQKHLPRKKLIISKNIFLKSLKVLFMNTRITKALENKFNTSLKFSSIDFWIDNKDFRLIPHTDDESIKLSLQIYLSNNNVGTSLYDSNHKKIYSFPFGFGCGYALLNNKQSIHGLDTVINDGRQSLFVRYQ